MRLEIVDGLLELGRRVDAGLMMRYSGEVRVTSSDDRKWIELDQGLYCYRVGDEDDGWEVHSQKEGNSLRMPRFWSFKDEGWISVEEAWKRAGCPTDLQDVVAACCPQLQPATAVTQ